MFLCYKLFFLEKGAQLILLSTRKLYTCGEAQEYRDIDKIHHIRQLCQILFLKNHSYFQNIIFASINAC